MTLKSELRWIVIVAAAAFAVFANSLGGDFVYDDISQIGTNPLIQDISLAGKALTSDVWAFKGDGTVASSSYWRPTFTAWNILNYQIFGLNPIGWHVINLLVHILASALLFLILRRWEFGPIAAFAVSLIFAIHPVHSESVAWISGSPDMLMSISLLGSFWFAENRRTGGGTADLAASILLFAVALGAKEVAILCVPIYFLIFCREHRDDGTASMNIRSKSAIRAVAGYAAVAAAYFIIRWFVIGSFSQPVEGSTVAADALRSAPAVFLFYLKQIAFPWSISINYPLRPVAGFDALGFVIPAIVAVTVITVLILLARRSFKFAIAVALFLLPLIPAFNLTAFPTDQIVHDRFLYLPLAGFMMLIIAAAELKIPTKALLVAAVIVSVPLSVRTFFANRVWTNDETLWANAIRTDPNSASGLSQYGSALLAAGRNEDAIAAFNAALDVAPNPNAYVGRAQALIATDRFEEAVWDLQTVTEMKNSDINAFTLYQSYEALGVALQRKGDLVRAERYLREARKRLPIYHAALTDKIAVIMNLRNNKKEALAELEAAMTRARTELLPGSKLVFFRLGLFYAENGDAANAKAAFQDFLKLTSSATDRSIQADRKLAAEALRGLN